MIRSDPEKPEWTRGRMTHAEDCRRVETLWYTFTIRPPSPRFKNFQIKADGLLAWWLEQWNMGRLWGVQKSLCASLVAFPFDICTPHITHTYKINPAKRSWTHVEDLFKRPFGIIRRPHTTVQSCNPQAASSRFKPLPLSLDSPSRAEPCHMTARGLGGIQWCRRGAQRRSNQSQCPNGLANVVLGQQVR